MANGHGGKRPGAGRKKGEPNRRSADIAARVESILGCSPVEKLAHVAQDAWKRAEQHRRDAEQVGPDGGEYLKHAHAEEGLAAQCLKEAAQYCAPKRKAVEHSGEINTGPTLVVVKPGERPDE